MASKQDKIETVRRMIAEITIESGFPNGFNEFDQTLNEFVSSELLEHVSHKGLDMLMDLIEGVSKYGVNRKNPTLLNE